MKKSLLILIAVVIFLLLISFNSYNQILGLSQQSLQQWSQVEVQYQRRFDLIPNLVAATKGVLKQEQVIFTAIAEARTKYGQATTPSARADAASNLDSALSRLLVIIENYPQLKSDATVARLMDELAGTENRVAVERSRFNEITTSYNTLIKSFPTNIFAKLFGYSTKSLYQANPGAEQAPKVDLGL